MAISTAELMMIFGKDVPLEFLRDCAERFHRAYRATFEFCREAFNTPERRDTHSTVRRATIEAHFRGAAKQHGAKVNAKKNKNRTAHHSEAQFGRIVLTQSGVLVPDEIVRRANFREGLAVRQLTLFGPNQPPGPEALLYALLLHGPRKADIEAPFFFKVAFPTPDCQSYAASIDLTYMLSDILRAQDSEEAVEDLSLRLLPEAEEEEGAG